MKFDVQAARRAGYSDDEINAFLAQERKFDLQAATQAGYSSSEILNFLTRQAAPAPAPAIDTQPIDYGDAATEMMGTPMSAGATSRAARTSVLDVAPLAPPTPSPEQRQAEIDKRLSYGAGPISPQTVATADALRGARITGKIPDFRSESEAKRAIQVARKMDERGERSTAQVIQDIVGTAPTEEELDAQSRQRFAAENPILGSLAAGSAGLISGTMNIPSVAADAFNEIAVNPVLRALGMNELPRVPTAFGTEYLTKAASDFMPKVGKQEMDVAVKRDEFAPWLMSKLAANSPQIAQSLVAAFIPPLRAAMLPGMAGTAAGQSFVEGDDSRVALAKGAVEYLSEKLPLGVFDKVGDTLKGMSPVKANTVLAVAGQRLLQAGGAITANTLTNAIEEVAAQFGGNVLDKYFQGKEIELTKGLAEAGVVGGATGKLMSLPQAGGALAGAYDPNRQIAREIDSAGGAFDRLGQADSQAIAIDMLRTERGTSDLISPAATVANFTPPDSPTKQAGLVDIAVPLPGAPGEEVPTVSGTINPATEQQFGLDKLRMGGANVGTGGALGGLAGQGGGAGGGLVGGSMGLAGPGNAGAVGPGDGLAGVPGANDRQAVPAGGAAGQQAAGLTGAAQPLTWTGRAKTGYANEQDAEQAMATASTVIDTRATHDWRVEPMGNGRFQIVGYQKGTNLEATTTAAPAAQAGQRPAVPAASEADGFWQPQRPLPDAEFAGLAQNPDAASVRAQAQQKLNVWSQSSGQAAPTLGKPDADAEATVNVLGSLFGQATGVGQRVVAYNNPGGENGLAIGGVAFVNTAADTDVSAPRTTFHEIRHVVEQLAAADTRSGLKDTPAQQFTAKMDTIFDDMTDDGKRSYIVNFLHKAEFDKITDPARREARVQELMAAPQTRSEMVADFLGNRATDRGFLVDLAKADPKGFQGFVQKWLSVIDNLMDKLRGSPRQSKLESAKVDQYVRDLGRAKMVARDALVEFRKGNLAQQTANQATVAGADAMAASIRADQNAADGQSFLKATGFSDSGPAAGEWVKPVSKLGDVIAKVVSAPGEPVRMEISADYMGRRFGTKVAEGEPAIKAAIEWASSGIQQGREKLAARFVAEERGLPGGARPPMLTMASERSRIGLDFKDVIKRIPELQEGMAKLQAGEITKDDYARLVDQYKPVEPYTSAPPPATESEILDALKATNREGAGNPGKDSYYGVPSRTLKRGDPVGVRLDIPSYRDRGTWVVTVHEPRKSLVAGGAGKRIGYEPVAAATDVIFSVNEKGAAKIAAGAQKETIATIEGKWLPITPAEAKIVAAEALKSKDWVQVGMDPERQSRFYNRKTMEPLASADQMVQIGPLVLAKNPTYADKSEVMFSERAAGARQIGSENLEPLSIDKSAPPKDKPVVLVFGGTFNPVHEGHIEAALKARELMRKAGYQVDDLVIAPSPQSLMKAKSRQDAVSLADRVAMLREAVKNEQGVTVTDRPSRIADRWSGKISRTAAMDWAQGQNPGKHVVMVAGDDTAPADAPPPGAGGALYTSSAKGMEGRSYVVMPREAAGDNRSSSMLRKLISKNEAVPETLAAPGVVRYYRALLGESQEVAIDGVLRDMNADNFGLPEKPVTLADSDPLLRPTIDLKSVQWQGRQVPREVMRGEVVADVLRNGKKPAGKPIVYLMGGGGAAGKGTIKAELKAQGAISYDAVDIDPDEIKAMIPEYGQIVEAGDWRAASVVHQESTKIAEQVLDKALASGYSIVLDKTMGSPSKGVDMINRFKSMGYEVRLFGVTVDPRFAIYRATSRALKTGRWVPTQDMLKAHRNFTPAFEAFANAADQAVLFENTDGPELLAVKTSDVLIINDKFGYNRAVERSENVDVNARTLAEVSGGSLAADRSSERSTGRPEVRSATRSDQGEEQGRSNTGRAGGDQGSAVGDREEAGRAAPLGPEGPAFSEKANETPASGTVGAYSYTTDEKGRIVVSGDTQRIRFLTRKVANATVVEDGVRFKGEDRDKVLAALREAPSINQAIAREVAEKLGLTPQELASTSLEYQTGLQKDKAFVAPLKGGLPEVVKFLEERRLAAGLPPLDITKPADQEIAARLIAAETLAAIRSSGNALQWYDETIARTLATIAVKYPELQNNRNSQMLFRLAMAITSQGLDVESNLNFAMAQYDAFRKQGQFPVVGQGEDAKAMAGNFILVNKLLNDMGPDMLRRFLVTPFTVQELRSAGFDPEGELGDEVVLGSSVLGPKIGFGFYSNLNGNFEPVTMDMWFMRLVGRIIGALRTFDADKFGKQIGRFRAAFDERGTDGTYADQFDPGLIELARTDNDAALRLARLVNSAHQKDFKDNRKAFDSGARKKSELVYASATMLNSADKSKDVPANGSERRQLRAIVKKAVEMVEKAHGQRIPPAAMQALVWYPEQELYKAMGVKLRVTSQDYAGAALKILKDQGYGEQQLVAAAESGSKRIQQKARRNVAAGNQAAGAAARQAGPLEGAERARFIRERYEQTQLAKERAEPKRRGVVFEVAPDPNNEALTAAWRSLGQAQRLAISERVAREIVPRVLAELDTDGIIVPQVGSYLDDTNPSFTLLLNKGDPVAVAKALGFALAQDSMMVVSPKPFAGGEKNSALVVEVGDKTPKQVEAIYKKLRQIKVNGERVIGGQSYANGGMTILNYSNVPTSELAILVDQKLNKAYSILTREVFAAFPEKKEYDYASAANDGRGSRAVLRQGARALRAEATAALERELRDAGVQFSQRARPDAAGEGRDRGLAGEQVQGQVTPSYGTPREGAASAVGYHYSQQPRDSLTSQARGTGLRGSEMERLRDADPKLQERIYFYIDRGTGIQPEAGVGGYAHRVNLQNLYDADEDPLRLVRDNRSSNEFELAVLDAGFDGYMVRDTGPSGNAVLLGRHDVPVEQLGSAGRMETGDVVPAARERVLSDSEAIAANKMLPAGQVSGKRWAELISRGMPEVYARLEDSPVWQSDKPMYRSELAKELRDEATAPMFSARDNYQEFRESGVRLTGYTPKVRELPAVSSASVLKREIDRGLSNLSGAIGAVKGRKDAPSKTLIGRLPHVFGMLKVRAQDFDIATSIVYKVFDGRHRDEFPDVTPREFVEAMYRPAMIFKDKGGKPREYELVLPITNENGAVLMPIKVSVENKFDPIGAVLSLYNKRVSNDPEKPKEMTLMRRIQEGNLLYVDPALAKKAMTGRPRGGPKDGVRLNDKFLSWAGVWPTIEELIKQRRVKTDVDLMEWIGSNYNPEGEPKRDWADAPSFSNRAAPTKADPELASIFKDLDGARGLGRIRAQERVDAHPMAETIRQIDKDFLDILERLDDAGLVKINCK